MKKMMWLMVLLTLTAGAWAQENKIPSKSQCDADTKEISEGNAQKTKTATQLYVSMLEFTNCKEAYATLDDRYFVAVTACVTEVMVRQKHYLDRHGFREQFMKEDADGQR